MEDIKFNYFKEKILKYLSEKENKENEEINKSLITQEYFDRMEKSRGYPVGTIREWKGNKYKKLDAHKWVRVYDKDSSSAKRSIGQIKHMAEQCETSQELMQLILKYRDRFSDENGRPIPLVQELSSYVSELNDRIELPRQLEEIGLDLDKINSAHNKGAEDGFRELQKQSLGLSDKGKQMFHTGSIQLDEGIRERLSAILKGRLESRSSRNRDDDASCLNEKTGKELSIYANVEASDFHDIFEIVQNFLKNGDCVDIHDKEDYLKNKNYLSADGLSGFSITPDGDLISVFNLGTRGFLQTVKNYIKQQGAKSLDCFNAKGQALPEMYAHTLGFKTASILEFNKEILEEDKGKEYADYFEEHYGNAPVHFMVLNDEDVEEKTYNKDQYDEAKNYQLENIPGAKKIFNADEIKTEDILTADVKPPMFEYNGKKWLVYPPLHTPESYHEFKNNLSEDENKRRNFAILQKQYQKANDIISKAKNITDLSNARDAIKSADKLSERIEGLKELNERFKKAIEKNYKNSMNNIQARYEKNSWPFSFKDDVYETEKPSKMSDDKIKQLENLGFTRWQKNGNDRLYISTYKLPDVETKWQKKDKKLAVIDGKELAYGKSADFFGTKAYIDVDTGEIVVDNDYFADVITNKINSLIDKTQSVKKSFIVKDNRIYIHRSLLGKIME